MWGHLFENVRWFSRVLFSAADRFYWDNGLSRAASLAYTTLLSLVPITALIFGLLGSFTSWKEHAAEARAFILQQFLPNVEAASTIVSYLAQFSEIIAQHNVVALLFLFITSILLLNSIEYALNEIWQVYETRTLAQRVVIFCALLVLAPILAVSGFYTAKFQLEPLLTDVGQDSFVMAAYVWLFPYFIDFLAFFSLYYLVPKAPVRAIPAAVGAGVSAILFGLAKWGFAFYVVKFPTYQAVYGAVAVIPIFLVWLYLAWSVVLLGAEVAYQTQYLPKSGRIWKRLVHTVGDGELLLGVQALVLISRAFMEGKKMPNDWEMAESLGCSSVILRPVLISLEKAGIVGRGDSRDMPITLMRAPERVTLRQLRDSLIPGERGVHFPEELCKLFGSLADNVEIEKVTLRELVSSDA